MSDAAPSDRFQDQLLDALLEIAPETGWTQAGLAKASKKAGLTAGQAVLAAPNGVADLLEAFGARVARAAGARLNDPDIAAMKVRQKVAAGVKSWLVALGRHKAAVKRAAASPANLLTGPRGVWAAADAIWSGLGDKSTDFNWYTKRMILSGVIGSTLAVWLGTDDEQQIDDFLDRRIENVMQFEKFKGEMKDAVSRMSNPMDLFGQRK